MSRQQKGFTLVEIQIAIGVLLLLAALLPTVISKIVDANRRASCLNNIRSLSTALLACANDNPAPLSGQGLGHASTPPPSALPTNAGGGLKTESRGRSSALQGHIRPQLKFDPRPHDLAVFRLPFRPRFRHSPEPANNSILPATLVKGVSCLGVAERTMTVLRGKCRLCPAVGMDRSSGNGTHL